MKTTNQMKRIPLIIPLILTSIFLGQAAHAFEGPYPPGDTNSPPAPLASWSFQDTNGWTSDQGYAPTSFTNIFWSNLGDGRSLVVNTNGAPACLNFPIYEPTNGATNLVLNASGSLTFWFAPNWAGGTNGAGPGQLAQLIDVGELTVDSSVGYFGLSVDAPGSNLWFWAQDGSGNTYGLSTPISWTTNLFHFIALSYSSTNVSIFVDGQLATNDPGGLSVWPNGSAQAAGIFFGSDTNGNEQAQGLFNSVQTYNTVLDSNDVQQIYDEQNILYAINPFDIPYLISSGGSEPSTNFTDPDVITGAGELQANGPVSSHIYGANEYQVWITNVTATVISNGTTAISFTIEGGSDGAMYDVFATGALESPLSDAVWYWEGQGGHFTNYTIAITSPNAFLILGTPADSDSDGLTDAYELLVSHSNPNNPDTDGSGISDGWQVLLGLDPTINQVAQPGTRSNYAYTPADWIEGISGIKSGSVTMDKEGNVTQVSE